MNIMFEDDCEMLSLQSDEVMMKLTMIFSIIIELRMQQCLIKQYASLTVAH